MTTASMTTAALTPKIPISGATASHARPRTIAPIPLGRLVKVELRKMFDTRAGFWLMASVLIVAVLASAAVIVWAPDAEITMATFSTAMGMPLSVVLPIIAILAITSEHSQRTGLTTYALVPWRGRVITAKIIAVVLVGVASMFFSLAVGAVSTLVASAITGLDPVWDVTISEFSHITLANILGMMMGLTLGVLLRGSAAAIVGYFVYALVLPGALGTLAFYQEWFLDLQPWVDVNYAINRLFEMSMTTQAWQQLAVTSLVWLWIPLAIGLRAFMRAEVK